ncbi:uncharacterized protein LOC122073837 isoform X2 [Macadamia integrifolia]|uniref:uncharacterized protein LOC122073837 isoform X2 n=1 Tax=Macadamia integrifolia TaxID=60698 RepID=UPI001C501228|nr:uncharacterized protein LOC122073837 isoform X2 [Macadamia integrifolia]
MAKRSDLSRKLLDDLRMRNEEMTMSHTSNYSKQMQRGGNFRKPMQGSRSVNTRETISSSMGDQNKRFGTRHNRPPPNEGASKEIVQVGRARNSENIGDLSMALTFALQNGGTLRNLTSSGNPVLGYLHHIRRSVEFGQMDNSSSSSLVSSRPSNSRSPTLSHLHIKAISKGVQKLNQILGACSNGRNFDRYSMDIGKELLKGAMELDESLRMLINLQEASEYKISPQRKQRIRLLADEDDEEITIEGNKHKQVNQPKLSFNGPSRSYPEDAPKVTKVSLLKQKPLALSYHTESAHFSSNNHTPTMSSNSVSHRRAISCSPGSSTLTASSEPMKRSNSSNSKAGKERIPNVIAKLMGLEELPPNIDPKNGAEKERVLKPEKVSKSAMQTEGRVKKQERTLMKYKSPSSQRTQTARLQGLHANIYATPGTSLGLAADKFLVPQNGSLKSVFHEEAPNFRGSKDLENMDFISISKPTIKINKLQMKITGIQQDKQGKETKQEKPNARDWEIIERGVNNEAFFSDDLQRMVPQANRNQEAADSKQDKGVEKHIHHKEKNNAGIFHMSSKLSNHQKAPHNRGSHQPQESQSQGAKLHQDEKRSPNRKGKLQVNNPKGTGALLKNSLKPTDDIRNLQKKLPQMDHATARERSSKEAFNKLPSKGSQNEDLINDGITTNHKLNILSPDERSGAQTDTDVKRVKIFTPQVLSEAVNVQPRQEKLSNRDMLKRVNSQKRDGKVDEVETRENRSTNTRSRPLKQQISVLQHLKQQKVEEINRFKKGEISIRMSREAIASKPMNLVPQEKAEPNSTFNHPIRDSCPSPRDKGATAPQATTNDKRSGVPNSLQDPEPMLDKDEATSSYPMSVQLKGPSKEGILGIIKSSQQEHPKTLAEALLGLLIPVDILHASAHKCKDDDSMLVLDYCYEVMKRKGRRKELTFHPCVRITMGSVKPKGLDELVTELHENLKYLKFFNQDSSDGYKAATYLHKMLERDIQNKNPDLNCMWDFGWSETMFACPEKDEVIQDVERFVVNGLIDEILEDNFTRITFQ